MRKEELKNFADGLSIKFKDPTLLDQALTHRSYLNESRQTKIDHNERLEFLGDAVLELIVSEYLFNIYPDRPEGELTSFRAATVKTDTLALISRGRGLGALLQMSRGEEATGGREKDYLLANAYEAVLGAIYLDQGYSVCQQFVTTTLIHLIEEIVEKRLDIDAKTKFQEIAQSLFRITPTYRLISESGPDHEKVFILAVMVGDQEFGRGEGNSKQRAEEQAARNALTRIEKMDKKSKLA